ncbi:MAG: hypothetical protein IJU18_03685 [Oscillospiraceae bacterium]|nr:hypothetical protein [Oscillospiraceae bacterium]
MKKLLGWLIAALLTLSLCATAYGAEGTTYSVPGTDLYVTVPDDLIVFTRDVKAGDTNLARSGLTAKDVKSAMEEGGYYLMGWDQIASFEFHLTLEDAPGVGSYREYSREELEEGLGSEMRESFAAIGATLRTMEFYDHPQELMIVTEFDLPEDYDASCGLQYNVCHNERVYNLTMLVYKGSITDRHRTIMRSMAESLVFDVGGAGEAETTNAFTYKDELTGTTFTVPADWTQQDEAASGARATFFYNSDSNAIISYNSADIWSEMSPAERLGSSRAEADNRILQDWDLPELVGAPADKTEIEEVTYGGKTFQKITFDYMQEETAIPMTVLLAMDHGYLYVFSAHVVTRQRMSDLIAMVGSVKYGDVVPESDAQLDSPEAALGFVHDLLGQIDWALLIRQTILSWLITLAACALPILLYRYVIRKDVLKPKKAKKVTIFYALGVFVAVTAGLYLWFRGMAPPLAVVLWSFVNYRVLAGPKAVRLANLQEDAKPEAAAAELPGEAETTETPEE